MKPRSLPLALLLALATLSPTILASNGAPAWAVNPPDEPKPDPGKNLVDHHEPGNNGCEGAEAWPSLTIASSEGSTGGSDTADWSSVELYRTESVVAKVTKGTATVHYAEDCGSPATITEPLDVAAYGLYPFNVAATLGNTVYTVEYTIKANDADTGADIVTHYVNALPKADPTERNKITGSLSHRKDLGADVDWYQIGTGLAHALDPTKDVAFGLLTVTFEADCEDGQSGFTLYESDMKTEVTIPHWGCASVSRSCVAASFSSVYAKLEADGYAPGTGAGYNFFAELSPLNVVDLDNGQFTYLNPEHPWCDSLTPRALGLIGDSMGVVDKEGRVVAKVTPGTS